MLVLAQVERAGRVWANLDRETLPGPALVDALAAEHVAAVGGLDAVRGGVFATALLAYPCVEDNAGSVGANARVGVGRGAEAGEGGETEWGE